MKKCAKCDFEYGDEYDGCPQCAQSAASSPAKQTAAIDGRTLVGLAGAILLFVGAFLPIVSLPIVGSMNYFNNGQGDGIIIVGLALISALLILTRRYRGLWATGGLSLLMLGYTLYTLGARIADARASMESQLAGNPFIGLAQAAMQSVQLQWGWAVLVLGAVLLLATAVMSEVRLRQSQASSAVEIA